MSRKRRRKSVGTTRRGSTLDLPSFVGARVDPQYRFTCLSVLREELSNPTVQFVRELEHHIHRYSQRDEGLYQRKMKAVITTFCRDPEIASRKTLAEIVALGDYEINSHTMVSDKAISMTKLPKDFKPSCLNEGEVLAKCKACGSTNITISQRQTRSADEGMTEFYECQCGKRWKN